MYTPGFGYVWVGFFVVALAVLSPKLYCHDVAPVLVSVTVTSTGDVPVWGVMVNPALGLAGTGVAVGVEAAFTVTCFVVVE